MLPQWHIKDHCLFSESASGRIQLATNAPLIQRSQMGLTMLSKHRVGTYGELRIYSGASGQEVDLSISEIENIRNFSYIRLLLVSQKKLNIIAHISLMFNSVSHKKLNISDELVIFSFVS